MSIPEAHELSRKLSYRLDDLGYSTARVAKRVQDWKKMSEAKTMAAQAFLKQDNIERLHVGSQAEGIALAQESDTDILQVNLSVVCVDKYESLKYDNKIIFRLDRDAAPAGYAYLRLSDKCNIKSDYMRVLKHSLLGEEMFMSSEKYIRRNEDIFFRGTGYISRHTKYYPVTGPAIPKTMNDHSEAFRKWWFNSLFNEDIDFVQSFPCLCPGLLQSWSVRPRPYDWPSKDMVDQVKLLQCYVVPVGKKESRHQNLQWRISFTPAEMMLVQSLNDTQRKVLITLRHFAKHRLKRICPNITSYILKNVIFWVSEEIPLHQFKPHLLLDRLVDALKFLRTCISNKSLKNYMIPGRNLLQGKSSLGERAELVKEITNMIADDGALYSHTMEMTESPSTRMTSLNYIDAISSEVADLFTTDRLAEFIIRLNECKYYLQYVMCYHSYITLPYIRKYRWRIPRGIIRAMMAILHVGFLPCSAKYLDKGQPVCCLWLALLLCFVQQFPLYAEPIIAICVCVLLVISINKIMMTIFEYCLPDNVKRFGN